MGFAPASLRLCLLLGCLSLVYGPLLYAAPCDQNLTPIVGHVGYAARDNRCEGFYVAPVSAPSLELISLVRGKVQYDLTQQERLVILTPGLGQMTQGPVYIRAVARPLRTYYRMDTVLPANGRFLWPVQDVLLPARLHAERLGVYGWVGTEADKIFVPLRVVPQGRQAPKAPIEVMVRSAVDLEGLVWRLAAQGAPASGWQQGGANIAAGQPVTIALPEGPRAQLRLDIAAKADNRDDWTKLTLQLIRDLP